MSGGIGHLILSGPLLFAVPVAAAAGAVTFLSPCVLPLVPGYLSYVTGMSGVDVQDAGNRAPGGPAGDDPGAGPAGHGSEGGGAARAPAAVAVTTVAPGTSAPRCGRTCRAARGARHGPVRAGLLGHVRQR